VLVDTSVWSLLLRRREQDLATGEQQVVDELLELIRGGRVVLIGPIRQELLSGISSARIFKKLKEALHPYSDIPIETRDYEEAAKLGNLLRANGLATTSIDMQICAIAIRYQIRIFTIDKNFSRYASIINLALHSDY